MNDAVASSGWPGQQPRIARLTQKLRAHFRAAGRSLAREHIQTAAPPRRIASRPTSATAAQCSAPGRRRRPARSSPSPALRRDAAPPSSSTGRRNRATRGAGRSAAMHAGRETASLTMGGDFADFAPNSSLNRVSALKARQVPMNRLFCFGLGFSAAALAAPAEIQGLAHRRHRPHAREGEALTARRLSKPISRPAGRCRSSAARRNAHPDQHPAGRLDGDPVSRTTHTISRR